MSTPAISVPSPEIEVEMRLKANGLSLLAWSVIQTIKDIYESDVGVPAPGDEPDDINSPANKKNHLKLTLVSFSDMLSRYRADPSDLRIRSVILSQLLLPTIIKMSEDGKAVIPDLNLCHGQGGDASRDIIETLGEALFAAPYAFQIMREWFLPSVVTYNYVPLNILIPLLNDMLIEMWYGVLEGGDRLIYWDTLQTIADGYEMFEDLSFNDIMAHSVDSRAYVNVYSLINQIKGLISGSCINMILALCSKLRIPLFTPRIQADIRNLTFIKASSGKR